MSTLHQLLQKKQEHLQSVASDAKILFDIFDGAIPFSIMPSSKEQWNIKASTDHKYFKFITPDRDNKIPTTEDYAKHLSGEYLIIHRCGKRSKVIGFDIDRDKKGNSYTLNKVLQVLKKVSQASELDALLSQSTGGTGWHIRFIFDEHINSTNLKHYAIYLKSLLTKHGLIVDKFQPNGSQGLVLPFVPNRLCYNSKGDILESPKDIPINSVKIFRQYVQSISTRKGRRKTGFAIQAVSTRNNSTSSSPSNSLNMGSISVSERLQYKMEKASSEGLEILKQRAAELYPNEGERQSFCCLLSASFAHFGVSELEAIQLIEGYASFANDTEISKRISGVKNTYKRIRNKHKVLSFSNFSTSFKTYPQLFFRNLQRISPMKRANHAAQRVYTALHSLQDANGKATLAKSSLACMTAIASLDTLNKALKLLARKNLIDYTSTHKGTKFRLLQQDINQLIVADLPDAQDKQYATKLTRQTEIKARLRIREDKQDKLDRLKQELKQDPAFNSKEKGQEAKGTKARTKPDRVEIRQQSTEICASDANSLCLELAGKLVNASNAPNSVTAPAQHKQQKQHPEKGVCKDALTSVESKELLEAQAYLLRLRERKHIKF